MRGKNQLTDLWKQFEKELGVSPYQGPLRDRYFALLELADDQVVTSQLGTFGDDLRKELRAWKASQQKTLNRFREISPTGTRVKFECKGEMVTGTVKRFYPRAGTPFCAATIERDDGVTEQIRVPEIHLTIIDNTHPQLLSQTLLERREAGRRFPNGSWVECIPRPGARRIQAKIVAHSQRGMLRIRWHDSATDVDPLSCTPIQSQD